MVPPHITLLILSLRFCLTTRVSFLHRAGIEIEFLDANLRKGYASINKVNFAFDLKIKR